MSAGPVLRDYTDFPALGELRPERAGEYVGAGTWRVRHHELHGARRPGGILRYRVHAAASGGESRDRRHKASVGADTARIARHVRPPRELFVVAFALL